MVADGEKHILLIKASLIEDIEDEAAKAAWTNMTERGGVFDKLRNQDGEVVQYGLRADKLAALVVNESTASEKGDYRELLAQSPEEAERDLLTHLAVVGEDGVTRIQDKLPFVMAVGDFRTHFHRLAIRAATAAAGAGGEEASKATSALSQGLARKADGWHKEQAELWEGVLEVERYAKNWIGTTALTYSPETGTISAIPHKGEKGSPVTAHGTHVVAQAGGRRVLGVFAGGPDGEPFRRAVAEAYLETYLEGGGMSEGEVAAFEYGMGGGKMKPRAVARLLLEGIGRGETGRVDQAWTMFKTHYRDKTDCPLQIGTAVAGGVHLGVIPPAALGKIFSKMEDWNRESGKVMAIVPDAEDSQKIVNKYGQMWTAERREDRSTIVNHSDRKVKEGSVGFIRVMRGEFLGAAQSGEDPGDRKIAAMLGPSAAKFDGRVLDKLDQLLGEIENKYGVEGDQGPASLPELCDRFLAAEKPSGRVSWKKQYDSLKSAYDHHKTARRAAGPAAGILAREKLYDAVATFMVARFGVSDGEEANSLRAAAKSLISSAAKTGYLYLITDPVGTTLKIGITANIPERLDDLARENGPMCLAACYAFKSIPVSSWNTQLFSEAVGGKSPEIFGSLTGLSGEAARLARGTAKKRFSALCRAFGYEGADPEVPPSDFMVFCVQGMLSLCDEHDQNSRGRQVSQESMALKLREAAGVDSELCGPLTALWGQYLKGDGEGTKPSYQRETLQALNRVGLTVVAGGSEGGILTGEAEKSFGLLGATKEDRDALYTYGSQLGPAVAETGAHRLFEFARRDSGEFFFLGDNFDQILSTMSAVAGGGEVHRYLLAESDKSEWSGRGQVARLMRAEINSIIKPEISLAWNPSGVDTEGRIAGLWEAAKELRQAEKAGSSKGVVETLGQGEESLHDHLPVHLQISLILSSKGGTKTKVRDVVEKVRQLILVDGPAFNLKLRGLGVVDDGRIEYKGDRLWAKITRAARDAVAETGKGSGCDIPADELVEFIANPKAERSSESKDAARRGVLEMKFSENAPLVDNSALRFKPALRCALGCGHGLGGYPVGGSKNEKDDWTNKIEGCPDTFFAPVGPFSSERAPVDRKDISAAAKTLDRELASGTEENKRALEVYGAVICKTMPRAIREARETLVIAGMGVGAKGHCSLLSSTPAL